MAIVEAGADLAVTNKAGDTLAHTCKSAKVMAALLERGLEPNATNKTDSTPLHVCESPELIELLIEAGGDPTRQNMVRSTCSANTDLSSGLLVSRVMQYPTIAKIS